MAVTSSMALMSDFSSSTTDPVIMVIVGEGKVYYVAKDKVAAALPMKDVASTNIWYIGERCTTEIFELFKHCLDGNKLIPIPTDNELQAKSLIDKYINLYHFARILDFRDLENQIMDILRAVPTGRDVLLTHPFVRETYDKTNARAHLRHYTVDSFLFKTSGLRVDKVDKEVRSLVEAGNFRFISECLRKKSKLKKPTRDTNRKTVKCLYHHHHTRKRCSGASGHT